MGDEGGAIPFRGRRDGPLLVQRGIFLKWSSASGVISRIRNSTESIRVGDLFPQAGTTGIVDEKSRVFGKLARDQAC